MSSSSSTSASTAVTTAVVIASAEHARRVNAVRRIIISKKEFCGMNQEVFTNLVGKKITVTDAFGQETNGILETVDEGTITLTNRWYGTAIVSLDYVAKVVVSNKQ